MRNTAGAPLQTTVSLRPVAPRCSSEAAVLVALDRATAHALLEALAAALASSRADPWGEPLTPRESEVLLRLSEGKSYGQIAAELVIELETVRTHARRVRRKLGVATSRELRGRPVPLRPEGAAPALPPRALQITP